MNKNTLIIADRGKTLNDVRQYITDVVIQDSVTFIGEYAFFNCSSLTSVTIGTVLLPLAIVLSGSV